MAIYNTGGFRPARANFVNSFDLTGLDTIDIEELGESVLEIENDNIENIQRNYEAVLDAKDSITQLDFKTAYNKGLLERKKTQYGINDDFYRTDSESLKDPFVKRNIESTLNSFLSDPEMKEAIMEAKRYEELEVEVQRMKRKSPKMAKVMMSQLNEIKLDETGQLSPMELSAEDFQEVNLDQVAQQYFLNNPNLQLKYKGNDPRNGYIVYDKVRDMNMTEEEFVEEMVASFGNDPRVVNTILANSFDPNKPPSEQFLRDPQAISQYLSNVGKRAFDNLQGSAVDSVIKEDKIGVARAKAALSSRGKGGGSSSIIIGGDAASNRAREVERELIKEGFNIDSIGAQNIRKLEDAESWEVITEDGQPRIKAINDEEEEFYIDGTMLQGTQQESNIPSGYEAFFGQEEEELETEEELDEAEAAATTPKEKKQVQSRKARRAARIKKKREAKAAREEAREANKMADLEAELSQAKIAEDYHRKNGNLKRLERTKKRITDLQVKIEREKLRQIR